MVRVVVLDRETGEVFTEDIGDDNPVALYVPGIHAHGYEALTDCLFAYLVTEEYDPADPDEHGIPWDDERVRHLWSTHIADSLGTRRVVVTGAGGQLGAALVEAFPGARGADARATGTSRCRRRRSARSTSCCTPRRGPTSTAPRRIRRTPRR